MVDPKSPAMQMLKLSRDRSTKIAMGIINEEHDDMEKAVAILESESKNFEDVMEVVEKNRKYMEDARNSIDAQGKRLLEAVLKFVAKNEAIETVLEETKEALAEVKTKLGKKTTK